MFKKVLLSTAVAVVAGGFVSAPAWAAHCPKDVKKLDAAMTKMDDKKMSKAKAAAAKGLALHKAGKHGEAIKVLHDAMDSLGVKH